MTMGAVHGKDEPQTIPSRAGFRFGKGMDMQEDGSGFVFYRRGAENAKKSTEIFFTA
jgi:hypothetical protein